jgi:predicted TIM-barrel fold metal-dependent hydrolase
VVEGAAVPITNCHIHTFTHRHAPDRFVPRPLGLLLRIRPLRLALLNLVRQFDRGRRGKFARYAEILETSYDKTQAMIFDRVRGFYPVGTRFVVLPMDMEFMGAGKVEHSLAEQHEELARLRDDTNGLVIPFAGVDARRPGVVESTIALLEERRFAGIKLYPPLGYHPNDPALRPLYAYAERNGVPVMTHCSRPAGTQYRGEVTERMRTDPVTGELLDLGRDQLLTRFTDPDSYRPILEAYPDLRVCLAHFGGAGDWNRYLDRPWDSAAQAADQSWLASIADLLRSGRYPNLWTDVSYTLFADEEHVYLLKALLSDSRILARVLFGSDFYVVANARLEERRRAVRIRAVLGEEAFRTIAEENPRAYLGEPPAEAPDAELAAY